MYEYTGCANWPQTSVYDLAEWKNGLAFKNIDFSNSGRPVIKIAELKAGITQQTAWTEAEYDPSVFVHEGDMLFSWSGNPDTSIDVFKWRGEDGWLNQHIFKVTPKSDTSAEFLFFTLKWLRPRFAEIARNKQTTGLGHVTIRDLKEMMVGLPDLDEQSAITEVLLPLQTKIDLNRQTNETLEAMARALFKDWFVDFGPTRAKMAGGKPFLAPDLWALFPDKMNDEGKPNGWKNALLDEIVSLTKGRSYKSVELRESSVALVTLKSFERGGGYRRDGLKPYTGTYKPEQTIKPGELVLALTDVTQAADVVGRPAVVLEDPAYDTLVASLDVGIIRLKNNRVGQTYIAELLRTESFKNHAQSYCTGTTVLHLAKDAVSSFATCLPSPELAARFEDTIEPFYSRIEANERESRTLAQTRDLLLPKLMSGEIRLREAEQTAGGVL